MKKVLETFRVILIYVLLICVIWFIPTSILNTDCGIIHSAKHKESIYLSRVTVAIVASVLALWASININRKVDLKQNKGALVLLILIELAIVIFKGLSIDIGYGILFAICAITATIAALVKRINKKNMETFEKMLCNIFLILPIAIIIVTTLIYNSKWNAHF